MKMSYCSGISDASKEQKKQVKFYRNTLIRFILQYRPLYKRDDLLKYFTGDLKAVCKEITKDF